MGSSNKLYLRHGRLVGEEGCSYKILRSLGKYNKMNDTYIFVSKAAEES